MTHNISVIHFSEGRVTYVCKQKGNVFVLGLSPLACSLVGSLFTNEQPKRVERDIIDTSAMHSGLVYDGVTNADCWAQNASTCSHSFASFRC